jgi:hypothetical protein
MLAFFYLGSVILIMNNKDHRHHTILRIMTVVIIAVASSYLALNYIYDANELSAPTPNVTEPLTSEKPCLYKEGCIEDGKYSIDNIEAVTTVEFFPIRDSVQPPEPNFTESLASTPDPLSTINVTKPSSVIKLQGKEVIKESDFPREDIHQCKIEFDKESIIKINQIIEQFSYEIDLIKTTYKINHQLTLNVISPILADNFNEILIYKIQVLVKIYKQSFGLDLQNGTELNLVILPSQESYENFIANLSLDSTNTQGLFWARSNYAFVAFNNDEQSAKTAFHETVHGINFSLVGIQSRWFNEGLAELFENMNVTTLENGEQSVGLKLPYANSQQTPMGFQELVYSEEQWWDINQLEYLYSSSLYFLSYLVAHEEGINIVSNLLREEGKNPCSPLTMDRYFQLIDENILYLPDSFDEWVDAKM